MKPHAVIAGVALLAASTLSAPSAAAQSWYLGIGAGSHTLRWEPKYALVADPSVTFAAFDNTASTTAIDVVVGATVVSTGRFRLDVDALATVNGAAWTLNLPDEPARFTYRMPFTALLTARPGIQVSERARVFAAVGLGAGRVQERKTSPSADRSSYDEVRGLNGVVTGGVGAQLDLAAGFALRAEYRYVQHTRFEYETRLPSGTRLERISDAPSQSGLALTLLRRWSR
jgi:opacity protein-like surface antigen